METNTPISEAYNMDCMELMAQYPDNYFDLAVVDPPYGIDKLLHRSSYGMVSGGLTKYTNNRWDKNSPPKEYFNQIMRVSKNQIIWGGNYFLDYLGSTRGVICWDKEQPLKNFSAWEMAWTSFDCVAKIFKQSNIGSNKIHPTQKPVALYDWIFHNYAKPTDKILDTHLGSGSSRIAAYKNKLHFVSCELDQEYFQAQEKRFSNFKSQLTLF